MSSELEEVWQKLAGLVFAAQISNRLDVFYKDADDLPPMPMVPCRRLLLEHLLKKQDLVKFSWFYNKEFYIYVTRPKEMLLVIEYVVVEAAAARSIWLVRAKAY